MTDDTINDPQRRKSDPEPQELDDVSIGSALDEALAKLLKDKR